MPGPDISLRESVLTMLRGVFNELLSTLNDSPSKPVVEKRLTEAFHREEEAIAELCDGLEARLLVKKDSYLADYKQAVDAVADKLLELAKDPKAIRDPNFVLQELEQLKNGQSIYQQSTDKVHEAFIGNWKQELEQGTRAIADRFETEARKIMVDGVVADDAMEHLDPDRVPKH